MSSLFQDVVDPTRIRIEHRSDPVLEMPLKVEEPNLHCLIKGESVARFAHYVHRSPFHFGDLDGLTAGGVG